MEQTSHDSERDRCDWVGELAPKAGALAAAGWSGSASAQNVLDEAAIVDGASTLQILFKVFLPVALPGLIAATIFAFTVSWAQFLYPLAFTTSLDQLVLPVGIVTNLIKGDVFNWGQIMTGALLGVDMPVGSTGSSTSPVSRRSPRASAGTANTRRTALGASRPSVG